jgi:glycosyltransferase involved in cell wall biosynthesis
LKGLAVSMSKKVSFVLPTRDEENTIQEVMKSLQNYCSKSDTVDLLSIIVTDDSRDQTRSLATKLGAKIVVGGGQGLGQAMYRGLKVAARDKPDVIISLDTDGQVDLNEIDKFLLPVLKGEADLVVGSRFKAKDLVHYDYPFINRFGIRVLVFILRKLTRLPLTDSHGGFRAMKTEVAEELELLGTHTYVQECIIDAVEKGFRVKEVASVWNKRDHGTSRIVGSIPKYIFYTLPVLILRAGQHIRFLYPLGMFFFFLSLLDFLIVGIETRFTLIEMFDRQSFHLILLLFMIGLNLFFFGFTIELLANIKKRINFGR